MSENPLETPEIEPAEDFGLDDLDTSPAAMVARVRRRVKTEGLEAACEALVRVCRDPKAPAPAKATAATTLFRAAGMLEKSDEELSEISPADMTPEQLDRALRQARQFRREVARRLGIEEELGPVD